MSIDVVDHIDAALGHLLAQFKDLPRVQGLIAATNGELNFIEVALQQIVTMTSIDDSEGAQLDLLGRQFALPRNDRVDDDYRTFLKAKVRALLSTGALGDLYAILDITDPGGTYPARFWYPASVEIRYTDPPQATIEAVLDRAQILRIAKAGGVALFLFWLPDDVPAMFVFSDFWTGDEPGLGWDDFWSPGSGGRWAGILRL